MTDLIDQLVDLLIRIETEPAKARFLIGRVVERAYQLQETIARHDDHHRVIKYVVGRLASGNSVRKIARELGWGHMKLYAFCDRHKIDRPRRKKILV